jgi:hypothetical protein
MPPDQHAWQPLKLGKLVAAQAREWFDNLRTVCTAPG